MGESLHGIRTATHPVEQPISQLPAPYYHRGGITIYHGDARLLLPLLPSVSALITDPPYGCKRPSQWLGKREDIQGNDQVNTSWVSDVRVEEGGAAYVFTSWEVMEPWRVAMQSRWNVRSCLVWDKGLHGLADTATCWAPRHELCLFAGVGRHVLKGQRPVDVIQVQRTRESIHPYEKPVGLIRRLITASDPSTIADPFMGTGATLVAATLEGKQAIGIEIEERYCEIAAERLRQGVLF